MDMATLVITFDILCARLCGRKPTFLLVLTELAGPALFGKQLRWVLGSRQSVVHVNGGCLLRRM